MAPRVLSLLGLLTMCACSARSVGPVPALSSTSLRSSVRSYAVVDLGAFQPQRVNNNNVVAGSINDQPAMYDNGVVTILKDYPGDTSGIAQDVNDAGVIVGYSASSNGHSTLSSSILAAARHRLPRLRSACILPGRMLYPIAVK